MQERQYAVLARLGLARVGTGIFLAREEPAGHAKSLFDSMLEKVGLTFAVQMRSRRAEKLISTEGHLRTSHLLAATQRATCMSVSFSAATGVLRAAALGMTLSEFSSSLMHAGVHGL